MQKTLVFSFPPCKELIDFQMITVFTLESQTPCLVPVHFKPPVSWISNGQNTSIVVGASYSQVSPAPKMFNKLMRYTLVHSLHFYFIQMKNILEFSRNCLCCLQPHYLTIKVPKERWCNGWIWILRMIFFFRSHVWQLTEVSCEEGKNR
jgi:hypothetical protein